MLLQNMFRSSNVHLAAPFWTRTTQFTETIVADELHYLMRHFCGNSPLFQRAFFI